MAGHRTATFAGRQGQGVFLPLSGLRQKKTLPALPCRGLYHERSDMYPDNKDYRLSLLTRIGSGRNHLIHLLEKFLTIGNQIVVGRIIGGQFQRLGK